MTALDKYTVLETLGYWKESPDQEPREVIVSFGNSTLLFSDSNEQPLGHWAMAATMRLSLDGSKAVYTPDTEGYETLEIDDTQMVEAIEQVSIAATAVKRRTPWLRWVFLILVVSAVVWVVTAAPDILRDQAMRMTSHESARKLGADMIATLDLNECRETRADAARDLLQARIFPEDNVQLVVVKDSSIAAIFPGNIILIGNDLLRGLPSPNALSSVERYLVTGNADKLATSNLFNSSSFGELFQYVTSGQLSADRLSTEAQNIVDTSVPVESLQLPVTREIIIRDQDWVALQGICLE